MSGYRKYSGDQSLKFGPIVVDYGPKGCTTHFTVTCPIIWPLINYYNTIVTYGASGQFKGLDYGNDGTTPAEEMSLEVSLPGLINNLGSVISELYFDSWELLTNESTDSVFNCPRIISGTSSTSTLGGPVLNYNDRMVLSRMRTGGYKNQTDAITSLNSDAKLGGIVKPTVGGGPYGGGVYDPTGQTATTSFQKVGANSVADAYGGNAPTQIGFEVIQKEQAEYAQPSYVLRHTSYCSAGATYNNSTSNTLKIYTTAQLLTECGTGWTYNLPSRLYSKIGGIPQQYPSVSETPYYTWGWLKKITREPVLANFMVEVSTEYELNLWSNLRYEVR